MLDIHELLRSASTRRQLVRKSMATPSTCSTEAVIQEIGWRFFLFFARGLGRMDIIQTLYKHCIRVYWIPTKGGGQRCGAGDWCGRSILWAMRCGRSWNFGGSSRLRRRSVSRC